VTERENGLCFKKKKLKTWEHKYQHYINMICDEQQSQINTDGPCNAWKYATPQFLEKGSLRGKKSHPQPTPYLPHKINVISNIAHEGFKMVFGVHHDF
jgi:hypothetical protein